MGPTIPDEAKGQVCPVCGGRGKVSSDFYDQVPWVALAEMGREREQAHRVLDMWGAPKTAYNYLAKAPTDDVLTLGGRIQCLLNPDNEEGFPNWRANASQAESHVRRLEEENARLQRWINNGCPACGYPAIRLGSRVLAPEQVQQVREALEVVKVFGRDLDDLMAKEPPSRGRGRVIGQMVGELKEAADTVLSVLGGGEE